MSKSVIYSPRKWKMFSHTYWSNALMVFIKPHLCGRVHERTFHVPAPGPQGKLGIHSCVFFPQLCNQRIKPLRWGGSKTGFGGVGWSANHACSVSCKSKTDVWVLWMCEQWGLLGLVQSQLLRQLLPSAKLQWSFWPETTWLNSLSQQFEIEHVII